MRGRLRTTPEDFHVEEILGYPADGDGEHVLLQVEKRDANTQWVARELARFADVRLMAVGYAGLKDRHALTRQAFSVHLAGRPEPDWNDFPHDNVRVLASARHQRKLKRGALQGNRFRLVVRALEGDRERVQEVLENIRSRGVPNYFGAQRFGHGGANVQRARAMFAGRRVDKKTRSLLLSAARSALFNDVLAHRVTGGCWDQPLEGEIWCLAGSRSWFGPEVFDAGLRQRLADGDIHPSGPLWGQGDLPSVAQAATLEQAIVCAAPDLAAGLERAGLTQARRPLRLLPQDLVWSWPDSDALQLEFTLPAGTYATVVVREVATTG